MSAHHNGQPCGTLGAYRRHLRRGERPCPQCAEAARQDSYTRRGVRSARTEDRREIRNGLPEFVPYVYRGTGEDQLTP
jgi:hypothetical protein